MIVIASISSNLEEFLRDCWILLEYSWTKMDILYKKKNSIWWMRDLESAKYKKYIFASCSCTKIDVC